MITKNTSKRLTLFINLIISIFTAIYTICISTIFTLNFTPLYSYAIGKYDLTKITGLDKTLLLENFKGLLNYLQNPFIKKLTFKSFAMSSMGEYHFLEVKKIFITMLIYILIFIVISTFMLLLSKQKKEMLFRLNKQLNYSSNLLISLIVILSLGFVIDFSKIFELFHKLIFNNQYWLFDPETDPVIYALPEEFFMLCGIVILSLVLIQAICFKVVYHCKKTK